MMIVGRGAKFRAQRRYNYYPTGVIKTKKQESPIGFSQKYREKSQAFSAFRMLRIRYPNIRKKQFVKYFEMACKMEINQRSDSLERYSKDTFFMSIIESRLDSVLVNSRFCSTPAEARQWISHGHVFVDGNKVKSASCLVATNSLIKVKDSMSSLILSNTSRISRKRLDNCSLNTKNFTIKYLSNLPFIHTLDTGALDPKNAIRFMKLWK